MSSADAIREGPSTLEGLFDWASDFAKILFADDRYKNTFRKLAQDEIVIFDSFSGTGNGSSAFKQQFNAMIEESGKLVLNELQVLHHQQCFHNSM